MTVEEIEAMKKTPHDGNHDAAEFIIQQVLANPGLYIILYIIFVLFKLFDYFLYSFVYSFICILFCFNINK